MRGQGSVYRPVVKRPDGTKERTGVWMLQYADPTAPGGRQRVSSGTRSRKEALRILRERIGDREAGRLIGRPDRVMFADLRALAEARYETDGRKSSDRLRYAFNRLQAFFGGDRAVDITAARLDAYALSRRQEGKASATVNRELSILRFAFRLAKRRGLLAATPEFEMAKEANARTGFFEAEDFEAVVRELPSHLKPLVRFAYLTGWRKKEMLGLTWTNVDLAAGIIRLEPGTTKNDEGRTFPLQELPELESLIHEQWRARDGLFVFHYPKGHYKAGNPIKSYDGAWRAACQRAAVRHVDGREVVVRPGLEGRFVHDFRRTAARRLERAGVPRSVAMKLMGHKTEAMYRRYAIAAEQDLRDGLAKLAAHDRAANVKQTSNISSPAVTLDRVTSGAA